MPCYHPLKLWHCINSDDKLTQSGLSRSELEPVTGLPLRVDDDGLMKDYDYREYRGKIYKYRYDTVPCGRCIGCRIRKSQEWTVRAYHESQLHANNCFLTLTFRPEDFPPDGSIRKRDLQLFFKRLRKMFRFDHPRYIAAGEYGTKLDRPHYHILLFNFDFADKILFSTRGGIRYYISEDLAKLWPYGYHLIGDVTPQSCAYVCKYVTKKITGELAADHYQGREPEFLLTSRRPGIAREWFERFAATDVYNQDTCILPGGRHYRPPSYYDYLESKINDELMEIIKRQRQKTAQSKAAENPERLEQLEQLALLRLSRSRRSFETSGLPAIAG